MNHLFSSDMAFGAVLVRLEFHDGDVADILDA